MTKSALATAVGTARAVGVDVVVIGATALATHGLVRSTADLDLLANDEMIITGRAWEEARKGPIGIDVRAGDAMDPLRGVVRIGPSARMPVDIVVITAPWARRIVARAMGVDGTKRVFGGIELPVARLSDIALLKLYAAASDDVEDAELFLRHPSASTVIAEVSAEIGYLPRDCRERWMRLEPRWRARLAR